MWLHFCVGSEVRGFLELEKRPVAEMELADLQAEVEGWRGVFSLCPKDVAQWMARLYEPVRFVRRNYQGGVGILLDFKLEPVEYSIGITEKAFDTLSGTFVIEDKTLVIAEAALMFKEFINDTREFDQVQTEKELAEQEIG